jgi:hypothetical protein
LNQLHAVLTPEQRAALVDKVEAHWTIWQNANSEPVGPSRPGYLESLASELRAPNRTWPTCRWMDRWTVPWQSRLYRTRCGNESNLCFQPNAPSRGGVDLRSPTARSSRGSSSCCGRAFRGSTCRRRWAAEAA